MEIDSTFKKNDKIGLKVLLVKGTKINLSLKPLMWTYCIFSAMVILL